MPDDDTRFDGQERRNYRSAVSELENLSLGNVDGIGREAKITKILYKSL